jgi:tripartite-type tricarboxylate transporter receptor subunit TctC
MFSRRQFLNLAAGAAALPAVSLIASAQAYPSRPLRIVVGGPPGGAIDILARLMGQWLSEHWGQPVVLESKPGAGTNIATEYVVHAAADGYTLLLVAAPAAINATLYEHLSFNFVRDIAPVAGIITVPNIMLVNPAFPAQTVPAFIAYAKANPGKVNFASAGNGTSPHMTAELFKMMTGIDMVHVAYRGEAPALTDLLGGQVQVMFATATASIEHVRAGKILALAVCSASRFDALPDLPTVGSFLPGYEAGAFFGVGAPKGTPTDIIDKLNTEINAALADPKMKARLAELGGSVSPGSPTEFGKFIANETEKWAKVVKFAGIKPE